MPVTHISAGSSTRVKDGPGLLKGIWVTPTAGASLLLADNPDLGASGPNFNNLTAVTSTIGLHFFAAAAPVTTLDGHAHRFANALTVAATSSARVSVFWE